MENKMKLEEMINVINSNIDRIEKKTFNIYFYVVDSEGYPNGMLAYIYQIAYELKAEGYNVTMLYSNDDEENRPFIGVEGWLGEKFGELVHKNINKENADISASDFIFIPEFSANVMVQTKNIPGKRVMILQNRKTLCEAMPVGVTPFDLKIYECIVPTNSLKEYAEKYFPGIKCHIVRPFVREMFRKNSKEKKLIVNIMSKDRNIANRIIKEFYWKFPIYKWITFRDLRGLAQENVANSLMDGAISVWVDDETEFGLPILEAIKCNSIVIAKVPDVLQEWMMNEDGNLISSAAWFDDIDKLPDMLAGVVRTWTLDQMPEELYNAISEEADKACKLYSHDTFVKDVDGVFKGMFDGRLSEFKIILSQINNNIKKTEE